MKNKWFRLAKKCAMDSDHHKAKVGCVIVKKNRLIAYGTNSLKTHPKVANPWRTLHAEVRALLFSKLDLEGCIAYVYRELKDGTLGMAKPCAHCHDALKRAGIKKVYYTSQENGYAVYTL